MIKFFRKIRYDLLEKNKTGKYLKYAIGEIVLVVIGILIALSINNWNEAKKTERMVYSLFEDVLDELAINVNRIDSIARFYDKKDSIYFLIMSNTITYDNYAKNEISELWNFTTFKNNVHLSSDAYKNLINSMEKIPINFKPVLKELNYLNNADKDKVDEYNNIISTEVHKNINNQAENFFWFTDFSQEAREKKIEYRLNSWQYKNLVRVYYQRFYSLLFNSIRYRKKAIKCYQGIAKLLNKPTVHESFKIDSLMVSDILGSWKLEQTPGETYTSYLKNNRLYSVSTVDTIPFESIRLSKSKYLDIDRFIFWTAWEKNGKGWYRQNKYPSDIDYFIFEKINDSIKVNK
jgi:Family of unknown function (DUF6090)